MTWDAHCAVSRDEAAQARFDFVCLSNTETFLACVRDNATAGVRTLRTVEMRLHEWRRAASATDLPRASAQWS